MNLRYVDIDQACQIHEAIIKRSGSIALVRDFSLLHSAIERPKATFDGQDMYTTVFYKAAALLQSICLNHPFTDGNKRTAWALAHKFLWDNGYHLKASKNEAVKFMTNLDNIKTELSDLASWLKSHSRKLL